MKSGLVASFAMTVALLWSGVAWSQEEKTAAPQADQPAAPAHEQELRLYMFADNIGSGKLPDAEQLKQLVATRGIQRVVCLLDPARTPEGYAAMVEGQGLTFEQAPIGIDPDKPKAELRLDRQAVKELVERLADTDVKTFIHDQDGMVGVPYVVFAYRTLTNRWQFADALKEAIQLGYRADEYSGLYDDMKLLASALDELPVLEPTDIPTKNLMSPGEKIEVGGVPLNVKRSGSGPALYLLHGGPGENHMGLRPYFDPLAQRFEVVYYDQRGCGLSGRPQFEEAYTLDRLVGELDGLREKLGHEKISLLGHSTGGVLALRYALKYPQRVDKLVLVSTWASAEEFKRYIHLLEATLAGTCRENFLKIVRPAMEQRRILNDSELTELVKVIAPYSFFQQTPPQFLEEWNRRAAVSALVNTAMRDEFFEELDLRERLPELNGIPTLVIAGKFDIVVPPSLQLTVARTIGGAQAVLFEMSGHYPYVEEQKRFLLTVAQFLGPADEQAPTTQASDVPTTQEAPPEQETP